MRPWRCLLRRSVRVPHLRLIGSASLTRMEAVWIALIVFGFTFLVFLVVVVRFPGEVRDLIHRISGIEVRPDKLALRFYSQAVREKEHRELPRESAKATLGGISGGQVLWVDDTPINNRLEARALRARGVTIDCAVSNDEAVESVSATNYDLILSDIGRNPPEGQTAGLELPTRLRAAGATCPIAFYTGRADQPTAPTGEPVFDKPSELFEFIAGQLGQGEAETGPE